MKNYTLIILSVLLFFCCSSNDEPEPQTNNPFKLPEKSVVLAEQANASIVIIDSKTYQTVWSWNAAKAGIPSERRIWFSNPSEVKPVFNNRYILMTASGGAVALIRIADSKLMYYANAGSNPHSAEVLPDGNMVAVSSTDGKLRTFITDTIQGTGQWHGSYELPSAHNVVWDRDRQLLFTTEGNTLYSFQYNFKRNDPLLVEKTRVLDLPVTESCGHDLFPVYGKGNTLWLTTNENVWQYDLSTNKLEKIYSLEAIKSVCNGPDGVLMLYPTTEWWADGLINEFGKKVFGISGAKIYKGRWMLDNTFSYPDKHELNLE